MQAVLTQQEMLLSLPLLPLPRPIARYTFGTDACDDKQIECALLQNQEDDTDSPWDIDSNSWKELYRYSQQLIMSVLMSYVLFSC